MQFESRFVSSLPADAESRNFVRQVRNACFSFVEPTPVSDPKIIAYSTEVAELLGIDPQWLKTVQAARVLAGNERMPGMKPYAALYGGHQFGSWAGQLGDGRAINLGELVDAQGTHWTLQLKGSGRTPYSRSGDGLAVLRSSVREFLCSEAMFHLGVPTTRALSLVLTGENVTRDMFYDGNPREEPGAIVCRVAQSFVRFGNFEILASRREHEHLKQLVDFTIASDFPEFDLADPETYKNWFALVCERTAKMIVEWMRVGFVHGVMNTDNMSILGLTIDYGPYGWIDGYEPGWTPNTTDASSRRYVFGSQPRIAHWNLVQLANALWPLFEEEEPLQYGLKHYVEFLQSNYKTMMANKLGIQQFDQEQDGQLIDDIDRILQLTETDMTIFYRRLANMRLDGLETHQIDGMITPQWVQHQMEPAYYQPDSLDEKSRIATRDWFLRYAHRLVEQKLPDSLRAQKMNRTNPIYVLRNYLAQEAIDAAATGNYSKIAELHNALRQPYDEQPGAEQLSCKRPEWARHKAGCSMLSCSS